MRLRVCDGSPHRGRNKWSISGWRTREQWLVGIINYMRVIGTINVAFQRPDALHTRTVHFLRAEQPRNRRHNLIVKLSPKAQSLFSF